MRVITTEGTAHEMRAEPLPELTTALQIMDFGPTLTPYLHDRFGKFDFSGIRLRAPDQTFDRRLIVDMGGREVHLLKLGPAHTNADTVVHVPDTGVLFTGDLLFVGCTPIAWSGPISNWITACDTMIGLGADTVVPGHGPVTDAAGSRLMSMAGRVLFTAGLIVGIQWVVITRPSINGWVVLAALGLPRPRGTSSSPAAGSS